MLKKYLKKYFGHFLLLLAGLIAQVGVSLLLPQRMAIIINQALPANNSSLILSEGLLMVALACLGGLGMVAASFFGTRLGTGFARDLRQDVFKHVLSFSVTQMDKFSVSSLITRSTNDISQLQQVLVMLLRLSFFAPLMGVGAVLAALTTAPQVSWILAVSVLALFFVILSTFIFVIPRFSLIQKLTDKLNLVGREQLTGLRVIRAFNNQAYEAEKFAQVNQELTKTMLLVSRLMSLMMPLVQMIISFTAVAVIWIGSSFVESGSLAIGELMAFLQYSFQIMMSFMMSSMVFVMLPRALISWRRLKEVLVTTTTIKPPLTPQTAMPHRRGEIEFSKVCFRFPGAQEEVLHDISFTTLPGKTTALIGSTGSGKSTLIRLIPRFYDVTSGSVKVAGTDVRDYAAPDLLAKIGFVPQKGVLFSGTVKSNLTFGGVTVNAEQITTALATAQASDFVTKMGGLESAIAQGGSNVSGGQKQRLTIARALAKQPEVYIFDDSFSALDFKTEKLLRQALQPLTQNASVIIVAQRISSIKTADEIIVLNKGKIAGRGTHQQLLKDCQVYQEIAASQLSQAELAA